MPGVKTRHAPHRRLDLLTGGAVHLGTATAVDVHVDKAGCDQHVAEVDSGGCRGGDPMADLADRATLDDDEAVFEELGGVATRAAASTKLLT